MVLTVAVIGLTIAGSVAVFAEGAPLPDAPIAWEIVLNEMRRLFNVGLEGNIPTWYSTVLLALCSSLAGLIASAKRSEQDSYAIYWGAMAFVLLALSLDEAAALHEITILPLRGLLEARGLLPGSGLLAFPWILPATAAAIVYAALNVPLLASLPPATRRQFLGAALIYLAGSIGMEAVEGVVGTAHGFNDVRFWVAIIVEECLEMLGLLVLTNALFSYMSAHVEAIVIRVRDR